MHRISNTFRKCLPYGTYQYCIKLNMGDQLILSSILKNYYILIRGRPSNITSKTALKKSRQTIKSIKRYSRYKGRSEAIFEVDQFMNELNSLCMGKTRFVGNPHKLKNILGKIYFTDIIDVVTLGFMNSDFIHSITRYIVKDGEQFSTKKPKIITTDRWFIDINGNELFFKSYLEASYMARLNNVQLYQTIQ